jgi:hypothetical protein
MLQVTALTRSADEAMWQEVLKWKGAVSSQQFRLRLAASQTEFAPLVAKLRVATSRLASVERFCGRHSHDSGEPVVGARSCH